MAEQSELSKSLSNLDARRRNVINQIPIVRNRGLSEDRRLALDNIQLQSELIAKREENQRRLAEINSEYAAATADVLNEGTLKFLEAHANIAAPTFTSIFAGFERARQSAADRAREAVTLENERRNQDLEFEQARVDLQVQRNELARQQIQDRTDIAVDELEDEREFVEDLIIKGTPTAAQQRAATNERQVDFNNLRQNDPDRTRAQTTTGATTVTQTTTGAVTGDFTNIPVPDENKQFFNQLGIAEENHGIAQFAYNTASQSELSNIYDNYPESVVGRLLVETNGFDNTAVSPTGALGIAQIQPRTINLFKRANLIPDDFNPNDPAQAIEFIPIHDANVIDTLRNANVEATLQNLVAAYNGPVQNVINAGGVPQNVTETRNYVDRVFNVIPTLSNVAPTDNNAVTTVASTTTIAPTSQQIIDGNIQTPPLTQFRSIGENVPGFTTFERADGQIFVRDEEGNVATSDSEEEAIANLQRNENVIDEPQGITDLLGTQTTSTTISPVATATSTTTDAPVATIASTTTAIPVATATSTTTARPRGTQFIRSFEQQRLDRLNELTADNVTPTNEDVEEAIAPVVNLTQPQQQSVVNNLNNVLSSDALNESTNDDVQRSLTPQTQIALEELNRQAGTNYTPEQVERFYNVIGEDPSTKSPLDLIEDAKRLRKSQRFDVLDPFDERFEDDT